MVHTALSWSNAASFDPILSAEVTLKFSLLLECKAGLSDQSRVGSAEMQTPATEHADFKQVRFLLSLNPISDQWWENNIFHLTKYQEMNTQRKVLLSKSFHLNGHTLGFHSQTQKLQ